jgi:hypothetical protein
MINFNGKIPKEYQLDVIPYQKILDELAQETYRREEELLKEALIYSIGHMPSDEEIKKNLVKGCHLDGKVEYQYGGVTILINEGMQEENGAVFTRWRTIKPADKAFTLDKIKKQD